MPEAHGRQVELDDLCDLDQVGDGVEVLHVTCPLSPTQNAYDRWHWLIRSRYRDACYILLAWQVGRHVECSRERPWARRVRIDMIRCSSGTNAADPSNLTAGLKQPIDCLVHAGVMPDDAPEYIEVGTAEDRPRGHWGALHGPGTHLYITRIEGGS